ncbi:hypothetical protein QBC47DRAFT_373868 [Echria macrotheca]|uniref:Uncharacterized protein n=1 Tax=Echria macrotheca TaxID=438768 RepID=A0AAJ0F8P0_9PEZI|nr:hypothetical protein QBC47DRAFT_373868 [Echria macrotheca]
MSANTSCPAGGNSLPEFSALAIPGNLTTTFIPGSNGSDKVMTACCAPNTVHIASGCYEWCEVPSSRLHNLSKHDIENDMVDCLQSNGWAVNQSSILGVHIANGAGTRAISIKECWTWVVFLSGVAAFGWGLDGGNV